ncbi:MAG: 1-acyl-sn-glycerol-3-phosphate acyltransferase [Deltaproteobacteria bacterium]|nr:MAG: 1-acyl-sn-glycerol-3-phosphate acyltransferase [Deltaproteobacteria bacterium]
MPSRVGAGDPSGPVGAAAPRVDLCVCAPVCSPGLRQLRFAAVGERRAVILVSILKVVLVGLNTVVFASTAGAVGLFDERAAYRLCRLWARINVLICGVRVRTRRLAPLDPKAPYVFMSNHRSQLDVLAVIVALAEFQLRWVAKVELTRVPVFGWALRRTGHIIIDRSNTTQAVRSLRAAELRMRDGISVMIFPEGTRSTPGETLLRFKKGGFMTALGTGVPIVPMAVLHSDKVLPRGAWRVTPGEIEVVVGRPIPVAGVERDELIRRVRAFLLEHLPPGEIETRRRVAQEAT